MKMLFDNLLPIAYVVIFLGGSILVHEIGHYVTAKKFGMYVPKFSIGFGPKLFGFRRNGTEFVISLFPLGGYVAIPQLADLKEIEGKFDLPKNLGEASCLAKIITAFAGPLANMIFAVALAIVIYFTGIPVSEEMLSTHVGYVVKTLTLPDGTEVPSPADKARILPNDKILSVDGVAVKKFDEIVQLIALGSGKDDDGKPLSSIEIERDGQQFQLSVKPEIVSPSAQSSDGLRMIGILPKQTLKVGAFSDAAPLKNHELRKEDRIISANGTPIFHASTLHEITEKSESVALEIERGGERKILNIPTMELAIEKPFFTVTFSKKKAILDIIPGDRDAKVFNGEGQKFSNFQIFCSDRRLLKKSGIANGDCIVSLGGKPVDSLEKIRDGMVLGTEVPLGVSTKSGEKTISIDEISSPTLHPTTFIKILGFPLAPTEIIDHPSPAQQICDTVAITFKTFYSLFHRNSSISAKHLMGPVGLINTLYSFAREDFARLLWFMILINVNLAIVNLLPFPVLDGGIIAILAMEKITGWKRMGKIFSKVQILFFFLLIGLIAYVTFFDIRRVWVERNSTFEAQRRSRLLIHYDNWTKEN